MTAKPYKFIYYAQDKFPDEKRICVDIIETKIAVNSLKKKSRDPESKAYNSALDDVFKLLEDE